MVKLDGILLAVVKEQDAKEKIKRLQEAEEQAKAELKESMKEFETKENAVGIILLETENGKTGRGGLSVVSRRLLWRSRCLRCQPWL